MLGAVVIAGLTMSLGGCSALGLPMADNGGPRVDRMTTGAILASAKVSDGVDLSDWEAVQRAVSGTPADEYNRAIPWSNPKTGSEGTIDASKAAAGKAGRLCRSLATTINGYNGVRLYRGEACQTPSGTWQIVRIAAGDGIPS